MGLKGYRLWVMGQLDSNVQSPTAALRRPRAQLGRVRPAGGRGGRHAGSGCSAGRRRGVAVRVAFESSKGFCENQDITRKGSRVASVWFEAMGELDSACTAPP